MSHVSIEDRRKEWMRRLPEWIPKTLGRHFDDQANQYPNHILVETEEEKWSYSEIQEEADHVARGLMALGVQKRDHVALWMGNYTEFIIYKLAIAKVGAVCIPLNTMMEKEEVAYTLNHSDTSILIMNDQLGQMDYVEMLTELCPELESSEAGRPLQLKRFPLLKHVVCYSPSGQDYNGMISHRQLLELAKEVSEEERSKRQEESENPDDVCDIIYTSGTTGDPKGAMLTHDNFLRCAYSSVYTRGYPDELKMITGLPLYHVFAYTEGFLVSTFVGGTFIPVLQFSPRKVFELIEKTKAQFMLAVPSMVVALVNDSHLKTYDLSSLYGIFCAASNAPASLWNRAKESLGLTEISTGYGMTEVAASGIMTEPSATLENVATTIGTMKPAGSAGLADLEGYSIYYKVVDVDTGEDLGVGEEGELVCKGPQVTKGYYKKPEETAKTIDQDGWLKTGDLGILQADGNFVFTGRSKEMYKTSGENVSPKSVEDVISKHPKVSQVHVVGIPDTMMGEVGVACVELKEGEEATRSEIIDYCRDKMARYKIPRHVVFMKAAEFPMTSTGKVRKFQLAKMMSEKFQAKRSKTEV